MKCPLIAACVIAMLLLGADHAKGPSTIRARSIGDRILILGELGLPVGQETTITGRKVFNGKGEDTFDVETIDGKAASLLISVYGIDKWPNKTKATLRGNEIGELRYIHLNETGFADNDPRWKGPRQQLFLSFHVSEVVAPAGLKIKD
jgi:hypothetical protein